MAARTSVLHNGSKVRPERGCTASYNQADMRALVWVLRGFVFFGLFAFALNNQQTVVVHWFFGIDWSASLVVVVLIAFAAGTALGVLAMLPAWWRLRRRLPAVAAPPAPSSPRAAPAGPVPSGFDAPPPRELL